MTYTYKTNGTCAREIYLDIAEDGTIHDVRFSGGCSGNTQAIEILTKGRNAREVQRELKGIRCGNKQTSCPDQLSSALRQVLEVDGGKGTDIGV